MSQSTRSKQLRRQQQQQPKPLIRFVAKDLSNESIQDFQLPDKIFSTSIAEPFKLIAKNSHQQRLKQQRGNSLIHMEEDKQGRLKFNDEMSLCVCTPEHGCGKDCHNRASLM